MNREPRRAVRADDPVHRHPAALLRKLGTFVRAHEAHDVLLELRALLVRAHAVVPADAERAQHRVDAHRRGAEGLACKHRNDLEQTMAFGRVLVAAMVKRDRIQIFNGDFHVSPFVT
jgi:hypothetical protein